MYATDPLLTGRRSCKRDMFDFLLSADLFFARIAGGLRSSCGMILTPVFKAITLSGNMGLIFIIAAAVMLIFGKTRKTGIFVLVALLLGFLFTNIILKNVVARSRPFADTTSEFYAIWKAAGSLTESGYSFPSGHTTAATAFGASLFLAMKKRYSWAFLLIPLIMGFTRIYFVVHYASDVLGGLIVGGVSATISYFIVRTIYKKIKKA